LRVAALAFGVLAGLVASLILALGGLDVAPSTVAADRQVQAIRFGLFLIGNLGMFGAALVLASPLAGAILLLLGAVAWVGAALMMHHSTDLVLVTPPSLMLIAAILAFIAHVRRPRVELPEPEILAPLGAARAPADTFEADEPPGMTIPSFAEPPRTSPLRAATDDPFPRPADDDWDPRKRRPPPPRARAEFRQPDDDDEDEPSGFARFALGLSSILSFGLYTALAAAAVLVFWGLRTESDRPTAVVAEAPAASSSSAVPPASAPEPSSSEPRIAPALPTSSESPSAEPVASERPPIRTIEGPVSVAETVSSEEAFGEIETSTYPPRLTQDVRLAPQSTLPASSEEPAAPAPIELEPSSEPSSELSSEPPPEDLPSEAPSAVEPPVTVTGEAATGALVPFPMSARMAALRTAPGTGPTAAPPSPAATDSGL
jgi:hypothetical protein